MKLLMAIVLALSLLGIAFMLNRPDQPRRVVHHHQAAVIQTSQPDYPVATFVIGAGLLAFFAGGMFLSLLGFRLAFYQLRTMQNGMKLIDYEARKRRL